MANKSMGALPPQPWVEPFCGDYAPAMLTLAQYFLWLGLIFAAVAAIAELVAAFRPAGQAHVQQQQAGGGLAPIIDALKGLLQALASAKPWLVLMILGILLLWMAGNAVPSFCAGGTPAGQANPAAPKQ